MNALPKALARRGHRVMAVAPRYEQYAEGWETGVRIRIRVYDQEHEVGPCLHEPSFLNKQQRGWEGGSVSGHAPCLWPCIMLLPCTKDLKKSPVMCMRIS